MTEMFNKYLQIGDKFYSRMNIGKYYLPFILLESPLNYPSYGFANSIQPMHVNTTTLVFMKSVGTGMSVDVSRYALTPINPLFVICHECRPIVSFNSNRYRFSFSKTSRPIFNSYVQIHP